MVYITIILVTAPAASLIRVPHGFSPRALQCRQFSQQQWCTPSRSRSWPLVLATPEPPTPLADEQQAKLGKLLISLLIDLIGMATYVFPLVGETGDLAWAPISALLINQLYGNALITGLVCHHNSHPLLGGCALPHSTRQYGCTPPPLHGVPHVRRRSLKSSSQDSTSSPQQQLRGC